MACTESTRLVIYNMIIQFLSLFVFLELTIIIIWLICTFTYKSHICTSFSIDLLQKKLKIVIIFLKQENFSETYKLKSEIISSRIIKFQDNYKTIWKFYTQ
jgi:hypothetical protein